MQGRGRADTGTSPCATRTARFAAACGAGTTQRAGKPPEDGTEVFVLGQPGMYEEKGEFQLVVTRMLPTAAIGAAAAGAGAGEGVLHRDGLFDPARKRPIPAARLAPSRWSPARDGAALRDVVTVTRQALALRRAPVRQRTGAGRRRGGRRWCARSSWSTGSRTSISASWAAAAAAARTSPPSTARPSAAPSPPCGCPRSRPWGTRPTSRSPTSWPTCARPPPRRRRRWRWRTGGRCSGSSTTWRRGSPAGSPAGPGWRRSGWPGPPTGCMARWRPCSAASGTAPTGSAPSSTR